MLLPIINSQPDVPFPDPRTPVIPKKPKTPVKPNIPTPPQPAKPNEPLKPQIPVEPDTNQPDIGKPNKPPLK